MNIKRNLKSIAGILTITIMLLAIIVVDVAASPPTNDNIADATTINSLPYSEWSSTVEATIGENDPDTCGGRLNSIWYTYSPTNDIILSVSASAGWSYFITLSIYQVVDGALTPISCQNEHGSTSNTFSVSGGETYYFELMSRSDPAYPGPDPVPPPDGGGPTYIQITQLMPPINDNFANATEISETPFSDKVYTTDATTEPGEPNPCGWASQRSIWYSFTPPSSGLYTLETPYEDHYDILAIYTGTDLLDLQQIECTTGWVAKMSPSLEAGTTYYVQAFTHNGGDLTINITYTPIPANDNFANATIISEIPFTNSADTSHTTTEPNEPTGCCWYFQQTIWYSFTH